MGMISAKSFDQPDEVLPKSNVSKRSVLVGKTYIARTEYKPGWRWSKDIKPTAKTASCEHHHQGVIVSGRLHIVADEGGERSLGPGDAFDVLPGHDSWVLGDEPCVTIEFQSAQDWGKPPESGERVLVTLMVTDIVGSTAAAARIGDVAWKALLARHYESVRRDLDTYRGIEVDTSGDSFLAMFDSAARAVRCAAAIRNAAQEEGIEVRVGVHSGEVDRHGEQLRGIAVHIAARIAALAQPGEILLSVSTTSVLEGSTLSFVDAGKYQLKGLAERRQLFRLSEVASNARAEEAPNTRDIEANHAVSSNQLHRKTIEIMADFIPNLLAPLAFIFWGLYLLVTGDGFSAPAGAAHFLDDYLHRTGLYLVLVGATAQMIGLWRLFRNSADGRTSSKSVVGMR